MGWSLWRRRALLDHAQGADVIEAKVVVAGIIVAIIAWLMGCATLNQRCEYYPDGTLSHYRMRSTVIGTGETEAVTTDCAAIGYSTRDTGLSDNGKEALGEIAEGAVKGALGAWMVKP